MMKSLQSWLGILSTATLVCLMPMMYSTPVLAQAMSFKILWGTADAKLDPYSITAHDFINEVEKVAPGRFTFQLFTGSQFGNEDQSLQALRLGAADFGIFTTTYIGNVIPSFRINDLPFLYANSEQVFKVLDGHVGEVLNEKLPAFGMVGLGYAEGGFREVINNIRPIRTPADLKGIKLRVQPSDLFIKTFKALGANPVALGWNDAFTATQQKTVDGLEIPIPVIYASHFQEITKYLSLTNHAYNTLTILASKRAWDKLDDATRKLLKEAAHKAVLHQRKTVMANTQDIIHKLESEGMQVNKIENVEAFRKLVAPIYEAQKGEIGAALIDEVLAAVKEAESK